MPRSSSSHSSRPPSIGGQNYGQSSACSSETANRILALRLQLEMEQKRRLDVERALADYSQGKPITIAGSGTKPLTEEALQALASSKTSERSARTNSSRSRTSAYSDTNKRKISEGNGSSPSGGNSRSEGAALSGRYHGVTERLPALVPSRVEESRKSRKSVPIPAPPARSSVPEPDSRIHAHVEETCDSPAVNRPQINIAKEQLKEGKGRRKPPLPKEAKQTASMSAASRFGKHKANDVDVYLARQRHEERMASLKAFEF